MLNTKVKPLLYICVGYMSEERNEYIKKVYSSVTVIRPENYTYPSEEIEMLNYCIDNNQDVLIDWSCPTKESRKFYIDIFKKRGYLIIVLDFEKCCRVNNILSDAFDKSFEPLNFHEEGFDRIGYPKLTHKSVGNPAIFFNLSMVKNNVIKNRVDRFIQDEYVPIAIVDLMDIKNCNMEYSDYLNEVCEDIVNVDFEIEDIVVPVVQAKDQDKKYFDGVCNALIDKINNIKDRFSINLKKSIIVGKPYPSPEFTVHEKLGCEFKSLKN